MRRRASALGIGLAVGTWGLGTALWAQIPMPNPREMSGIPLPSGELEDGTVSVRLIRGELANNIVEHPVEIRDGERVRTEITDANGRAQFSGLAPGTLVYVTATVEGEQLASRQFEVPAQGGTRVMLVATPPGAPAMAAAAGLDPQPGRVVFGGDSRILIEIADEAIEVYYLLEAVNGAQAPIVPSEPLAFEMPEGAASTTVLEGAAVQTRISGSRVTVGGPFPPGRSAVNIAFFLPHANGEVHLVQALPAALERVAIIAEHAGEMSMVSPQLDRQQQMPLSGRTYLVGAGPALAAGDQLSIRLTGLPHHSTTPRTVALGLALLIVGWAVWATSMGPADVTRGGERLLKRREALFGELVRLEREHRDGQVPDARYVARRGELVDQLERLYERLEHEVDEPSLVVASPQPALAAREGAAGGAS